MKKLGPAIVFLLSLFLCCSCSNEFKALTITSFLPYEGSYIGGTFSASVIVTASSGITQVTIAANGKDLGPMTKDIGDSDRYWKLVPSRQYPDGPLVMRVSAINGNGKKDYKEWKLIVDNTPPEVSLVYPSNGQIFSGDISIYAQAADNLAIDKVVFHLNGIPVARIYAPPYRLILFQSNLMNGPQIVSVVSYDRAGNSSHASKAEIILRR